SGLGLTPLAGLGGTAAALGATLAQPAFALAAARWQRRKSPAAEATAGWRGDAWSLILAWLATAGLFAALLAWPLATLLAHGTLAAAFMTSLAFGLALIAAWRAWPFWHGLAREGGAVTAHWLRLARYEAGAWRGVAVALGVALLAALPLLLAWPGLLVGNGRWALVAAALVLAPVLHALIQRVPPPARHVDPWVADDDGDATQPADAALAEGEEAGAALYQAARGGRVAAGDRSRPAQPRGAGRGAAGFASVARADRARPRHQCRPRRDDALARGHPRQLARAPGSSDDPAGQRRRPAGARPRRQHPA